MADLSAVRNREREHSARSGWHVASQPHRAWFYATAERPLTRGNIIQTRSGSLKWRNRFNYDTRDRDRGRLRGIRLVIRLRSASPDRDRSGSTCRQLVRRKRASHRKNRPARLRWLRAHG